MIIYKDIISGDEMFSDTFPVCEFKDGIFYKVTGKMVSGDVEELDAALFGANPSAEEETEQSTGGGSSERVCNVVKNHQLVSVGTWDKKAFKGWIKDYVKNVEKKLKEAGKTDEAEEFKKLAMDGVKYLMANIKDFDVYAGEKMDAEATHGFMGFEEDGITPFFLFFKHAIIEEKV